MEGNGGSPNSIFLFTRFQKVQITWIISSILLLTIILQVQVYNQNTKWIEQSREVQIVQKMVQCVQKNGAYCKKWSRPSSLGFTSFYV